VSWRQDQTAGSKLHPCIIVAAVTVVSERKLPFFVCCLPVVYAGDVRMKFLRCFPQLHLHFPGVGAVANGKHERDQCLDDFLQFALIDGYINGLGTKLLNQFIGVLCHNVNLINPVHKVKGKRREINSSPRTFFTSMCLRVAITNGFFSKAPRTYSKSIARS